MKLLIPLTLSFLFMNSLFAQGEISQSDYALKGVNKIQLTISIAPNSYPTLGLTDTEVYENVSYLLRKDGVEVFSNKKKNTPTLNILFIVYEKSQNMCDIHISMSLWERVTISSNRVKEQAITWNRAFEARNMSMDNKSPIQNTLEYICKVFVNTLLAINPKR
jgi:hypothetical protein